MKFLFYSLFCIFFCIILINLESKIELYATRLTTCKIKSKKKEKALKLFFLSDFHENKKTIDTIMSYIKKSKPELILIGGDMIVSHRFQNQFLHNEVENSIELLSQIKKFYEENNIKGTFIYAYGNHESRLLFNRDKHHLINEQLTKLENSIKENGFILLNDSHYDYEDNVSIYSIMLDKGSYAPFMNKKLRNEKLSKNVIINKIGKVDETRYNILLLHTPDYYEQVEHLNCDLILCGHYHGGLIRLPIIGCIMSPNMIFFPPYSKGHFKVNNTNIIVSAGLGTHSVNIRVNNYPEICEVIIDGTN